MKLAGLCCLLAAPALAQVPTSGARPATIDYLALAAAADSSGRTSLQERALAIRKLARPCARETLPVLTGLARPYLRDWVIWHSALTALSECPFEELAPFWREMITFPREPVREIAIVGLLRTGTRGDLELIQEATHRETNPVIVRLAAKADSVLRLSPAERGGALPR
ncbi:MAG: hypothetical protein ACHQU1_06355 [Gemmatimonadales bacterium]